jgi:hypothetical protein
LGQVWVTIQPETFAKHHLLFYSGAQVQTLYEKALYRYPQKPPCTPGVIIFIFLEIEKN